MIAKDIMTPRVVTATPDSTVSDIAALLLEHCISAVPVVDGNGAVVGIVSEGDLMRRPETDTETRTRSWWLQFWTGSQELASEYSRSHGQRAADVMTKNVVTVDEATPVAEIAQILEEKHIKRVPVLRDGTLVGIVSRANLIRGLATRRAAPLPAASQDDETLRSAVLAALEKQPWANLTYVNATVENGVVHLWGLAESDEQNKAYEIAARDVPGVTSIENHMSTTFPAFYYAE